MRALALGEDVHELAFEEQAGAEVEAHAALHGEVGVIGIAEIGAVIAELGRQPRFAREWFIKYQDRVLFGKDSWAPAEYPVYFRVLETADDRALRFKNNAMRGGLIENVYMRDVQVGQVADRRQLAPRSVQGAVWPARLSGIARFRSRSMAGPPTATTLPSTVPMAHVATGWYSVWPSRPIPTRRRGCGEFSRTRGALTKAVMTSAARPL